MEIIRINLKIDKKLKECEIQVGDVLIESRTPLIIFCSIFGGYFRLSNPETNWHLKLREGNDMFLSLTPDRFAMALGGGPRIEIAAICLSRRHLERLLGRAAFSGLTSRDSATGLAACVRLPGLQCLGDLLREAITPPRPWPAGALHAQAKIFEYLSLLAEHLGTTRHEARPVRELGRITVERIREHLDTLEGRLPTLEDTARRFQIHPRRFQAEFARAFGMPFRTFTTRLRLDQARAAVLGSDLPLKVLADRFGYSHVNNFINAFKKQFGCAPGQLRKTNQGSPSPPPEPEPDEAND
jgi:AraC-like DNA-binding protein